MNHIKRFRARMERSGERGAGLVEYLFLTALIAIVCMVSVTFFGQADSANLTKSANALGTPPVTCPAPGQIRNGVCEM